MRHTNYTFFALLAALLILGASWSVHDQDAPLTDKEQLGKLLFLDEISSPDGMACAACHAPEVGFTGPDEGLNKAGAVYKGAIPSRFGNRKPPSAAYAAQAPVFHYDEALRRFVGGNFWDGRATGELLGNPAADQALGPFLNPVEQNNPSKKAVLDQIAVSDYADLWEKVWGEPISTASTGDVDLNYNRVGLSIAEYEASSEVNPFSSKYDYYLAGEAELTALEMEGLDVFEGAGFCSSCHPAPLFTNYTFDNLGIPKNPDNPFYDMDQVYLDNGEPINPMGDAWIDKGLGGFLESHPNEAWRAMAAENMGKHRVPTLRNVAKSPRKDFTKAFGHNGVFKSLEEIVHFYNTRDVADWASPEVAENINSDELGDLALTEHEEAALVAFLETLSDGWTPAGSSE